MLNKNKRELLAGWQAALVLLLFCCYLSPISLLAKGAPSRRVAVLYSCCAIFSGYQLYRILKLFKASQNSTRAIKNEVFYISIFPSEAPSISEIFSHIRGVAHFFKPFRVVFFAVNHKCCIVFYMLHFYKFNYFFPYSNTFPSVHY